MKILSQTRTSPNSSLFNRSLFNRSLFIRNQNASSNACNIAQPVASTTKSAASNTMQSLQTL